jgi:hypothetical protein
MAKRNDIHSPKNINPADYVFVGIWTSRFDGLVIAIEQERQIISRHMTATGGNFSTHEHGGNCHVCGAHCIYSAVFYHAQTNVYIRTGMDCAEKMGMQDETRFKKIRDAATAANKARKGKLKAEGILTAAGLSNAWLTYCLRNDYANAAKFMGFSKDTPIGIISDFALENGMEASLILQSIALDAPKQQENIICDIVGKLVQYGSLSEKQMNFLAKLTKEIETRPEIEVKKAEQKAQWQAEKENAIDVPEGRVEIVGTVLKVEVRETDYGTCWKMTVKCDGGYIVWGSVPSGLGDDSVLKGKRVKFTATLARSDKDTKFGFFKCPKKAEIIG